MSTAANFWVIVEQVAGTVKPVTLEVVNAARSLADQCGAKVTALYLGADAETKTQSLIQHGADRVEILVNPHLARFTSSAYLQTLLPFIREGRPDLLLLPATIPGNELASALTANLGAGQASDCISMEWDDGVGLKVRRRVYDRNAISTLVFNRSNLNIVTVRPNVFRGPGLNPAPPGKVARHEVHLTENHLLMKIREVVEDADQNKDVKKARIVVSGGLGMQSSDNFKLIEELADVLGAAVGVSLPVVVNGWRGHANQVGKSGRTISPDLYIACGISGADQHLEGMATSKCIVAINKDPYAPIFSVADFGIVGDVLEVLPTLTEEIKKALGSDSRQDSKADSKTTL